MVTEAQRPRRRSWATPRSAPRRWPGACLRSSRSAISTRARRELDALLRTAERTAQPFILHVAEHYGSAIALCEGRLEAAEATGAPLARVEPAADRARRVGHLRDPDVQRPARAGAAGGARAGRPGPRRRPARRRAVAAGPRRAARRARDGGGGAARARPRRRRRARPLPRVALARVAHVPRRRLRGARRRGRGGARCTPSSSRSRART